MYIKKMVHIEPLPKPNLGNTKMNCNNVISKKLTEFPMTNEAFSTSSFNIIVGKPGQGKTSLMTCFVKTLFKKVFETIYIFMPEGSRASIENDVFGKHLPPEQVFTDLTVENITQLYQDLQKNAKEGWYSLVIIDDLQTSLKDKEILNILKRVITKTRHLRTTVFLLQQNYIACDKSLRELASNIIIYNLGKSQLSRIFDEVLQMDKAKYEKLIDLCFIEPHDWLLINLHKSRSIYRMGDLVVFGD